MLPLAGSPTLAVIGREVICGRERADLLAVEVDTGRPVIIEVKLAAKTDRRQALTQILGYAAYLRRSTRTASTRSFVATSPRNGYASVAHAAKAAALSPTFDSKAFQQRFENAPFARRDRARRRPVGRRRPGRLSPGRDQRPARSRSGLPLLRGAGTATARRRPPLPTTVPRWVRAGAGGQSAPVVANQQPVALVRARPTPELRMPPR